MLETLFMTRYFRDEATVSVNRIIPATRAIGKKIQGCN